MIKLDRTSTQLVNFLGVELSVELANGSFANVFRTSPDRSTTVPAAVDRLSNSNFVPASVNIEQYHSALGFLLRADVAPATARTLALVFVDVSRALGVPVEQIVAETDRNTVQILEQKAYEYINQLRDNSSQLTKADSAPLILSGIARELDSFVSSLPEPSGDWSTGCFELVVDPPPLENMRGRRVAFDPGGQWFAYSRPEAGSAVRILNIGTWDTVANLDTTVIAGVRVSALSFSPSDPLLAVGMSTNEPGLGLRVYTTTGWEPVRSLPAFTRVNSAEFSPDGQHLAVVHSESLDLTQAFLTVIRRSDWSVVHTETSLRPITVRWSPEGDKLAVYGNRSLEARLIILDTSNWNTIRDRQIPGGSVAYSALGLGMDWLPDNHTVVIPPNSEFAPSNLTVYQSDINSRFTVDVSLGLAYSAAATTGSEVLVVGAAGSNDVTVSVVDTQTWTETHTQVIDTAEFGDLPDDVTLVSQLAFSPGSEYLALVNSSPEDPQSPLIFRSC